MSHLGIHTSSGYNCFAMAIGDTAAGVDHIQPVAQGCVGGHHSLCILFNRNGFTSQSRLLCLQIGSGDQASVCGNVITRFDQNNITRHQLGSINDGFLSIAAHARMGGRHILKRFQGFFRLALLNCAHDSIQNNDEQDQRRLKKLCWIVALQRDIERDGGCGQQDQDHGVFELAEESFYDGLFSLCLQPVLAHPGQCLLSLGGAQTGARFCFQLAAYILRGSIIRFHSETVSSFLFRIVYY